MNRFQLALTAALVAGSSLAMADQMASNTTRDERMDTALQDYRSKQANDSPGPAARAEESMKRGARKAGHAIEHGATATGHAIKKGAQKTGDAIRHVGEKIQGATTSSP